MSQPNFCLAHASTCQKGPSIPVAFTMIHMTIDCCNIVTKITSQCMLASRKLYRGPSKEYKLSVQICEPNRLFLRWQAVVYIYCVCAIQIKV